ncbi:MAG: PorT family protein [Bacteroidales bacterium]|nr:PorT family protein [Bacteroidales bacterium]
MQYEDDKNFDLEIKAMLEDAEEKVPSRVWSAVSGRIGSSASKTPVWWKWAGAGMAAVCAVLAAVLFIPDNTGSQQTVGTDVTASVESVRMPSAPEELSEEIDEVPEIVSPDFSSIKKYIAQSRVTITPVAEEASDEEPAADAPVSTSPATSSTASSSPAKTSPAKDTPVWTIDPFAEPERPRKKQRISITLDGALLGNDTEASVKSTPWMGGSGNSGLSLQELSTSTYGIPLSFGVGIRFNITDRFSIGTGLNYSLLSRKFDGSYQGYYGEVKHNLQYVGIPVNAYYTILQSNTIKFYTFAGGEAEYAVSNKYHIDDKVYSEQVKGLQYSAAVGLGVEFRVTDFLGIYIDPSARYYFNCKQPNSIRTVQPFMINFEAGLRFSL